MWTVWLQNQESSFDYAFSRENQTFWTKETCTDCDYSHPIASKVKAHYRKIHLGIKEERRRKICRRKGCPNVGLSTCSESDHFLLYCEHCEFTTSGLEYLKTHLKGIISPLHWKAMTMMKVYCTHVKVVIIKLDGKAPFPDMLWIIIWMKKQSRY